MVCPRCSQVADADATFCGHCGYQLAPVNARGSTVVEETQLLHSDNEWRLSSDKWLTPNSLDYTQRPLSPPPQMVPSHPSHPSTDQRTMLLQHKRRFVFIATLLALLVIGLSAGVYTLWQGSLAKPSPAQRTSGAAVGAGGSVFFSSSPSSQGQTDTVKITADGLNAPASGMQYDAWLIDQQAERTQALGKMTASGSSFALTFSQQGHNVLGMGNTIIVTQETNDAKLPTSKPVLTASFPPLAFIHIKHLLFHFDGTPGGTALLVGLQEQASLVNAQALLLKGFSGSGNTLAIRCTAQNILNLVEGQQGQHTNKLPEGCQSTGVTAAGDGFGLLGQNSGYIEGAAAHASLAATASDATPTVKIHARHVEIALENMKGWLTTVDNDAQKVLDHPDDNAKIQEIATLASQAYNGVDINNDEHVDPVPGEAGAVTAFIHGQLMAGLTLQP